jgi:hypothetical protein
MGWMDEQASKYERKKYPADTLCHGLSLESNQMGWAASSIIPSAKITFQLVRDKAWPFFGIYF